MLVTIDEMTQFLKLPLMNLKNLSYKHTHFKEKVKFHLPLGDKGLNNSKENDDVWAISIYFFVNFLDIDVFRWNL